MPRKARFSVDDLKPSAPVTDVASSIQSLAEDWGLEGDGSNYKDIDWRREWENLVALGSRFLVATGDHGEGDVEWHHLLVGVGNFKRQSPLGVGVAFDTSPASSRQWFKIPACGQTVAMTTQADRGQRPAPEPWRALTALAGLGVPTATTVLAALWPREHFIFDRRVRNATIGLVCGPRWGSDPGLDGKSIPRRQDWELYRWARRCLHQSVNSAEELLALERGLYVLDRYTMDRIAASSVRDGWTWSEYADRAHEILAGRTPPPTRSAP